jgi:PhnB protein
MSTLNPYLNFPGNTEEAFNFYKAAFGTEFIVLSRFGDNPGAENMPEADRAKIMHVSLPIGEGSVLMGTDTLESQGHQLTMGNNIQLAFAPGSEAEADRVFHALSPEGKVTMPLQKTFWNAYFGMLTDKFGIQWMVNYDYPRQ